MLIGLTGKAGAGKDTVADYLVKHHNFTKLSWAGPLKSALAVMGFPEPANRDDKERLIPGFDFTWREAAQKLGTEWGRGLDPDIWMKIIARQLDIFPGHYVLSDCRFENETRMVRQRGGAVLHITGRQAELGANASHASEAGVDFLTNQDYLINNSAEFEWTVGQVNRVLLQLREMGA